MSADAQDIEEFFDRLIEKQKNSIISDSPFVSAFLTLRKPIRLDYKIDAILDDLRHAHDDEELFAHNKNMELFDGITATFGFESNGRVQIIDEEYGARLQVNTLGMVDYVRAGRGGGIGDGWYEKREFLFRLYVPPSAVRDMIEDKAKYCD